MDIILQRIKKSDPQLQNWMRVHYSQPKGFVGRQLIYKIIVDEVVYGATTAGSATLHLPNRFDFFGRDIPINNIVNNTFFHVEKQNGRYPMRNFVSSVIQAWRERAVVDWPLMYGSPVEGFETLVEPPRSGECYRRDGWTMMGMTKGYTCKRSSDTGNGTDSWGGARVWDTINLRPKQVFYRCIEDRRHETILE